LQDLVAYRLGRARETLEEAKLMADAGHANACVNRVYYSCFYAVSALLASRGLSSSKHTGVRSLFGRHFICAGLITPELGRFYNDLFESRQESDYKDFSRVSRDELPEMMEIAPRFIDAIEALIRHSTPA
jgi:uncharacterized protein (UPF0332 family)